MPVQPALKSVESLLMAESSWTKETALSVQDILDLLSTCLNNSYIKFRGQFYEMVSGLAMGSPVSPIVANIFMADLEKKAISTMENPPKLWLRFVDDALSIVKRHKAEMILQHLNKQHPGILFTWEIEDNKCLPYLDTLISRVLNGRLSTTVYRKPTQTDRYLAYDSHHPQSAKFSVVDSLLKRAENIVTDKSKEGEICHLTEVLL